MEAFKKASILNDRKDLDKVDEPHKDDPKHEEKEKKKAKDIKDKAEEILDMHKEEVKKEGEGIWSRHGDITRGKKPKAPHETIKIYKNGQWTLSGNED